MLTPVHRARGFTLIEILVVMAIAALLSAMLFGAFSRVREKGRSAVCQNNLKQLYVAIQQYVQDHDGRYPKTTRNSDEEYEEGIFWWNRVRPYVKDPAIRFCPSFSGQRQEINSSPERTDYGYNHRRLNEYWLINGTSGKRRGVGKHEVGVPNTATIPLIFDTSYGDELHHMTEVTGTCGTKFYWSTRHSGGANYAFLDGHVKWYSPHDVTEVECSNGPRPELPKE
jgi:prepilin-type processing-associated H-X9-DG protein/prepilin-type N-terminal cleavage/methylation domain-containing protein